MEKEKQRDETLLISPRIRKSQRKTERERERERKIEKEI